MNRSIRYAPRPITFLARYIALTISKLLWFVRYRGLENIPDLSVPAFLVAANHQTYLDPLWIAPPIAGRRFRFMAIATAFDWRIIGPLIRYLGAFPVHNDRRNAARAFGESVETLKDGGTLYIFPEGERQLSDAKPFEFKTGAARIALSAGVPILPVTISGGERVWPQDWRLPRFFRRVTVEFHPLSYPPDVTDASETINEWTRLLEQIIIGTNDQE